MLRAARRFLIRPRLVAYVLACSLVAACRIRDVGGVQGLGRVIFTGQGPAGAPLAGIGLELRNPVTNDLAEQGATGADGKFEFYSGRGGVPLGDWTVVYTPPAGYTVPDGQTNVIAVFVQSGSVTNVTVVLKRAP